MIKFFYKNVYISAEVGSTSTFLHFFQPRMFLFF